MEEEEARIGEGVIGVPKVGVLRREGLEGYVTRIILLVLLRIFRMCVHDSRVRVLRSEVVSPFSGGGPGSTNVQIPSLERRRRLEGEVHRAPEKLGGWGSEEGVGGSVPVRLARLEEGCDVPAGEAVEKVEEMQKVVSEILTGFSGGRRTQSDSRRFGRMW